MNTNVFEHDLSDLSAGLEALGLEVTVNRDSQDANEAIFCGEFRWSSDSSDDEIVKSAIEAVAKIAALAGSTKLVLSGFSSVRIGPVAAVHELYGAFTEVYEHKDHGTMYMRPGDWRWATCVVASLQDQNGEKIK